MGQCTNACHTLGEGDSVDVQVTGGNAAPTDATAVVLSVTVVPTPSPGSKPSYLTVYPTGNDRPTVSNLNYVNGVATQNLVEVPVGSGGHVTAYNNLSSADVIFDLLGYYTASSTGPDGFFNGVTPARVLDTRSATRTGLCYAPGSDTSVSCATPGPGGTVDVQVRSTGGIPGDAEAVVLNLTETNASGTSYLTAYPAGGSRPNTSNLNFVAGQTRAARVTVPVSSNGRITIYNNQGSVDVIADVSGWYTGSSSSSSAGSLETPLGGNRILDTRFGTGSYSGSSGPGAVTKVQVTGHGGVPAGATAAVLNLTATNHVGDPDYLTAYPSDRDRPLASDLNLNQGETPPNLLVVPLAADGSLSIYNNVGTTDLILDVFGYFTPGSSASPTPSVSPS